MLKRILKLASKYLSLYAMGYYFGYIAALRDAKQFMNQTAAKKEETIPVESFHGENKILN